MAHAGGRPRGSTKWRPEYDEMLIEHMAQGLSFESFAGVVGVCKETLYNWAELHPSFLHAKKNGSARSQLFWEKAGMQGLWSSKDESFNTSNWIFQMKNRFRWRDKPEDDSSIERTVRIVKEVMRQDDGNAASTDGDA